MVVWMEFFKKSNSCSVLLCRLFLQKKVPGNEFIKNYSGTGGFGTKNASKWEKNRSNLWRNDARILSQENCRFVAIWKWFRSWRIRLSKRGIIPLFFIHSWLSDFWVLLVKYYFSLKWKLYLHLGTFLSIHSAFLHRLNLFYWKLRFFFD